MNILRRAVTRFLLPLPFIGRYFLRFTGATWRDQTITLLPHRGEPLKLSDIIGEEAAQRSLMEPMPKEQVEAALKMLQGA